jgi:anti-sigma factor RsiW
MSPLRLFRRRELVCREVVTLLTDYLEDALPARDRERLEAHLSACPHCSEFLVQLRTTIKASATIEVVSIDEATRDDLVELHRRWVSERA